eukprot:600103-Prymnesium_polylepis.1
MHGSNRNVADSSKRRFIRWRLEDSCEAFYAYSPPRPSPCREGSRGGSVGWKRPRGPLSLQ